ncbi:MAG: acyl-CoA-binding protein [Thiomonas sp.]|nr:acyl-CoA-binding protein [Thiomonas sp.]
MTDSAITADLQAAFDAAIAHSKTLTTRPDNLTLLQLYALYKQGSSGDVSGERPGMTDFVDRAKWDAWAALQGTSRAQAMRDYIDRVHSL